MRKQLSFFLIALYSTKIVTSIAHILIVDTKQTNSTENYEINKNIHNDIYNIIDIVFALMFM